MEGLTLLNPRGLWLLAGAVPIIVLYILKIQRRRQRVPSTWLWAAAQRDLLAKHPFKKLIAELPLILQLVALALLALALARPAMRGGTIDGDHVAIVIDTSASMGALTRGGAPGPQNAPAGTTRLGEAKTAALEVVASLAPGADAFVLEGARDARVVSPLERDARHLRAAIGSLEVREVEGDLAPAVALAADRLRSLPGKRRIVILTDGALARDTALSASGLDTQIVTVGDPEDNAAIVRVDVRSGVEPSTKREQVQVFAMVRNYATKPRDAYLTLTVEGRTDPLASRRLLVPPDAEAPVQLTFEPGESDQGKGLVVELSPHDALAIDDVAYGRVPAGHKMPITLASRAPYSWVARALDADPDLAMQRLGVEQLAAVNVDPDALVIVEGACPDNPPGHDLLIVAPPVGTCLGVSIGAVVDQPQLTSWEAGDPRLRFLTLDGVHVAEANRLGAEGPGAALVRAGNVTLIADASVPGRTVTILGFDPGESDWPLKASFVLFVRNVLEVARLHRAQGGVAPIRTGDPLRVAVPSGVTSVQIEGPTAKADEAPARGGFALVPALERAGFTRVRWTAPHIGGALIAANLTSERESDIRARPIAVDHGGSTATTTTTAARFADSHHEWTALLALVAALVIGFDLVWLTRRARGPRGLAASSADGAPLWRRRAGGA